MNKSKSKRLSIFRVVVLPIIIAMVLILVDQIAKAYFHFFASEGKVTVIKDFFYFAYLENKGAAWGFLNDKSWGQLFFKILTGVALLVFFIIYYFIPDHKRWLRYAMVLIIAGTIGNFIDRLAFSYVVDFFEFHFGSYNFPTFNIADAYLTVGVALLVIYYLFVDEDALLISKKQKQARKEKVKALYEELEGK